jgi:23S rRNA (guanosine2251-2'-O)-methyltransferase
MSKNAPLLFLVAHNVRSAHNVGSLLRTADACGINQVLTTGYTPYPRIPNDTRLPFVVDKLTRQIAKTALGAERTITCTHHDTLQEAVIQLRSISQLIHIYALEQSSQAVSLPKVTATFPCGLIVGNEVEGLVDEELQLADTVLEIPMLGQKESLNVSVAAGIALYELRRDSFMS